MNHCVVYLKLKCHCKSTTLKFSKKEEKKAYELRFESGSQGCPRGLFQLNGNDKNKIQTGFWNKKAIFRWKVLSLVAV